MRPITPQLILEILRIARHSSNLSPETIQRTLMISKDRAQEALRQLANMKLIVSTAEKRGLSDLGRSFLNAALSEDSLRMHEILMQYSSYALTYECLRKGSGSVSEISRKIGMSEVTVDIVLRLIRWTHPELTKNPETSRYYFALETGPPEEHFLEVLTRIYSELSDHAFGIRRCYVKIPLLRERACEQLGIARGVFDRLLSQSYAEHSSLIELASAPLSRALRAPFTPTSNGPYYYYLRIDQEE